MTSETSTSHPSLPARILVVDDDEHLVLIVQMVLTKAGYEVQTACDGFQGLERARAFLPDLVISDIQMPRMGGVEFRSKAGRDPDLSEVPFLFITGYRESLEAVTEILHAGDRALQKPVEPSALIGAVEGFLGKDASSHDSPGTAQPENRS